MRQKGKQFLWPVVNLAPVIQGAGDPHPEALGLHTAMFLLNSSPPCPCGSKQAWGKQGDFRDKNWGESPGRCALIAVRKRGVAGRPEPSWQPFSPHLHVCPSSLASRTRPRAAAYLLLLCFLPTVASAQCSHREFECQYLCLEMNGKVFVTQRQSFFKWKVSQTGPLIKDAVSSVSGAF